MLTFELDVIDAIRKHVLEHGGEEAGGLLVAEGEDVVLALVAGNCAGDRRREFGIDAADLAQLLEDIDRQGLELAGSWHSHPNGQPHMSHADAAMAGATGALLIVAPGERWEWALWDPVAGGRVQFAIAPPRA